MPQKFDNRALVVTQAEIQRWKQLNINYMSDEHDDQDTQVVLLHQPQWRSKSESSNSCSYSCNVFIQILPTSFIDLMSNMMRGLRRMGQLWQRSREELGVQLIPNHLSMHSGGRHTVEGDTRCVNFTFTF